MYNTLGFTSKAERDAEWAKMKAAGERGVVRYTTHDRNHPQIVYVLAHPVVSPVPQSAPSTEVPLTEAIASGMLDAGGNTDEQTNILATQTQADTADATEPTSEG